MGAVREWPVDAQESGRRGSRHDDAEEIQALLASPRATSEGARRGRGQGAGDVIRITAILLASWQPELYANQNEQTPHEVRLVGVIHCQ
jgi:hypothetical protein